MYNITLSMLIDDICKLLSYLQVQVSNINYWLRILYMKKILM